jgi:hypothetical protein
VRTVIRPDGSTVFEPIDKPSEAADTVPEDEGKEIVL